MSSNPRPSQILFLSQPRTGCHLLERMLTKTQPNLHMLWHPYVMARPIQIAMFREDSVAQEIPGNLRSEFTQQIDAGNATWKNALSTATAANDVLFVHSHPNFPLDPDCALEYITSDWRNPGPSQPRNNTGILSSLLLHPGTVPLITFRHPASTAYRCYKSMQGLEGSANLSNLLIAHNIGWWRQLYDWYIAHGIFPVLVEAEDYIASKEFVKKIATSVGLDENQCVFTWEKATEEEMREMIPAYVRLQQTLLHSTGMIAAKAEKVESIEAEKDKWQREYGSEIADLIEDMARAGMRDYEYLKQKKLQP